jgi:hypothetical protein
MANVTRSVRGPDGQTHTIVVPDNFTDDQIIERLQQGLGAQRQIDTQGQLQMDDDTRFFTQPQTPSPSLGDGANDTSTYDLPWYGNFGAGLLQGAILDPAEGLGQLAERATGFRLAPQGVRDWANKMDRTVQGSGWGKAGEIGGALGSLAVPLGVASKLGTLAKVGRAGARAAEAAGGAATAVGDVRLAETLAQAGLRGDTPMGQAASALGRYGRGATVGALAGALQPVRDKDTNFFLQKLEQAGAGLAGGALLASPVVQKALVNVPLAVGAVWLARKGFEGMPLGQMAEWIAGATAAAGGALKHIPRPYLGYHGLGEAARLGAKISAPGEYISSKVGGALPAVAGAAAGQAVDKGKTFLRSRTTGESYPYQDQNQ